jgi:hypothetical protein
MFGWSWDKEFAEPRSLQSPGRGSAPAPCHRRFDHCCASNRPLECSYSHSVRRAEQDAYGVSHTYEVSGTIHRASSRSDIRVRPGLPVNAPHFRNRAGLAQCILPRASSGGLPAHTGLWKWRQVAMVVEVTGVKYVVFPPILFP